MTANLKVFCRDSKPMDFIIIVLKNQQFQHIVQFTINLLTSPHLPFPCSCLSVVSLQTPEELDDSDFETEDFDVRSRTSVQTEDDQLIAGQSARVSWSSF